MGNILSEIRANTIEIIHNKCRQCDNLCIKSHCMDHMTTHTGKSVFDAAIEKMYFQ